MEYLISFAQAHESFRVAEIEALAVFEGVDLTILKYEKDSPYCIVKVPDADSAKRLVRRSILTQSVHELWGHGATWADVHASIKERSAHLWPAYKQSSFKFDIESYRGSRSNKKRVEMIESLSFLPFDGKIAMKKPDELFTVFEQWQFDSVPQGIENPDWVYFGRYLGSSSRDVVRKYDLKKRGYISTTSMDSELALITANMALAGPGKLFYDPFAGTGSFPVACAHFGAVSWGSDLDGRTMRGQGGKKSLRGNFAQYGLRNRLGDCFAADLTNSPLRKTRLWDGIVCDPPYGVREGLMVLGLKDPVKSDFLIEWSKKNHTEPTYVPPKRPYSFLAMLDDILVFATETLVDRGRLSFWMPTANDEQQEVPIPSHPSLELVSVCVQPFYKWSRRLLTYSRIPDAEVSASALEEYNGRQKLAQDGTTADELNPFRESYFKGFKTDQ